jgi:hypothetical protein
VRLAVEKAGQDARARRSISEVLARGDTTKRAPRARRMRRKEPT